LLAKKGRFDLEELRRLEPDSPKVAELKTLTRDQDGLVQMQTRLVNQLTACRKRILSCGLAPVWQVAAVLHVTLLANLPNTPSRSCRFAGRDDRDLAQRETSSCQAGGPTIWQEVHRPQLQASEITVRTKSRLMLSLVKQLLVVIEEIAHYEKEIQKLFLTHPDQSLWRSLPGAGKRLAPRLLAEWGDDRSRYADANSVQTLAGTAPVPFESGNYARAHKRFA
jgi:transposase